MPKAKTVQKAYELLEGKAAELFGVYDKATKDKLIELLGKMKAGPDGKLFNNPLNRAYLFRLERELENLMRAFVSDNFASQVFWDAFVGGQEPPGQRGLFFFDAAEVASVLARATYHRVGIKHNTIIAENMYNAVGKIKADSQQQRQRVYEIIHGGMYSGKTYVEIIDALEEAGIQGLGPYVGDTEALKRTSRAETVLRGVMFETYQQHQNEIAGKLDTEHFQMMGPPPMIDPNGHRFCQDYYGEVHTQEEWVSLAEPYRGEVGMLPEMMFAGYRNGYGCRHVYDAVAVEDVEEAKEIGIDMARHAEETTARMIEMQSTLAEA